MRTLRLEDQNGGMLSMVVNPCTLMELEAKWDQVKVQTSWKLEPCYLAESQSIPSPSATTTDAASTLVPTHIKFSPLLAISEDRPF